jgi:hypothetical protein
MAAGSAQHTVLAMQEYPLLENSGTKLMSAIPSKINGNTFMMTNIEF